jgi:hypothetical protein
MVHKAKRSAPVGLPLHAGGGGGGVRGRLRGGGLRGGGLRGGGLNTGDACGGGALIETTDLLQQLQLPSLYVLATLVGGLGTDALNEVHCML